MKNCPVCSSSQLHPVKGYEHAFLTKCSDCGMIFTAKQPSIQEQEAFYKDGYDLTRFYSPITKKRYEELLSEFETYKQTGRILDIGAGYGFFLEEAKNKGWDVYGTELTDEVVSICEQKGITMHKGELKTAGFPDNHFDVIVMIEAIEHVTNVGEMIGEVYRILRPGGLVYITTPNFNALNRYRLKEKYDVISYPLHLSYFTPGTLKKLFEKRNFKTQSIKSSGISRTRYKTSTGQSNQAYVSETSDDEMLRHRIEKSTFLRGLKSVANGMLNLFGIGENLKGWFVKP